MAGWIIPIVIFLFGYILGWWIRSFTKQDAYSKKILKTIKEM